MIEYLLKTVFNKIVTCGHHPIASSSSMNVSETIECNGFQIRSLKGTIVCTCLLYGKWL